MIANSGDIDDALVAQLANDAALRALLPDGVYFDAAPHSSKRFVLLKLLDERDEPREGGRAWESALYSVEAIGLSTALPDMKGAAWRIDQVLEDASLTIPPPYALMAIYRESRIRFADHDSLDPSLLWFHRGGRYRLQASLPDDFTAPSV